jgi:hypothetical protein
MVTHTLLFSFPEEMTEADREQFFREGADVVLGSGLAQSYRYERHVPLASGASAAVPPAFATSWIARITCADFDAMRHLFASPRLGEFTRRWHGKFPYDVASANSED